MPPVVVIKNPPCNAGDVGSITSLGTKFHMWKCVSVCSVLSDSFVTPWTAACWTPLSMETSRKEYWSRLPFPAPGDLPNPGMEHTSPASPALAAGFFTAWAAWEDAHSNVIDKYQATLFRGVILRTQWMCRCWRESRHPMSGSQHRLQGSEQSIVLPTASTVTGSSWTRLQRALKSMGSRSVSYPTVCLFLKMYSPAKKTKNKKQKPDPSNWSSISCKIRMHHRQIGSDAHTLPVDSGSHSPGVSSQVLVVITPKTFKRQIPRDCQRGQRCSERNSPSRTPTEAILGSTVNPVG